MEIIADSQLSEILNDCYLLLDTGVFIDAFNHPVKFGNFFNLLKKQNVALVTIEAVILEFLKGAPTVEKYEEKLSFLTQLIREVLPTTEQAFQNAKKLILTYKENGRSVSITDLLLGATVMNYQDPIFIMTKNTTDFPTNIFKLKTFITLLHTRSIQNFGIYYFE